MLATFRITVGRRRLVLLALLLATLSVTLIFCSCQGRGAGKKGGAGTDTLSQGQTPGQRPNSNNGESIPVEVTPAARQTVHAYVSATSTLEALRTAQLLAETTGQVVAIYKEEGDRVDKDEVLIRLEDTAQNLDCDKARIDLEVAEKDWQRAQELENKGILSAKELDEAKVRRETARHAKERADYELDKTRIAAPFAGIVTERNVQVGETVTPGKHLTSVADFNPLVARFHVPESEVGPVRVGHPVMIEVPLGFMGGPASSRRASSSTNPGSGTPAGSPTTALSGETVSSGTILAGSVATQTLPAKIHLISPIIDQGTGTVKLTAHLPNPSYRIRPGTFVRARVVSATHESALTIPRRALLSEDGTEFVFVVESDTTRKVQVRAGITDNQSVEILSGLSEGDLVVTVGHGGLTTGDKVKVMEQK